ncbi:hypothetical protein JOY44_27795 (plasmid) [Phormidium sp. CLA17]|uniref:DUF6714 family protein n=1 Tax=Leptolyngbya sp. Cla-17 TaxID=2803751 RepID=UPI0019333063|nr:DUF6714 family protein [Leptolyngbya sp. Cla-17]MBM0745278.1 hypothetical protein [Leptolyngbya sp. Cla-17]
MTSQVLIEQIASAFANVERWDGVTLHQAIALDSYASDKAVAAARLQDTDTHWTEIQRVTLVDFESALSFMDEQGTRYYLPAFIAVFCRMRYGQNNREQGFEPLVCTSQEPETLYDCRVRRTH